MGLPDQGAKPMTLHLFGVGLEAWPPPQGQVHCPGTPPSGLPPWPCPHGERGTASCGCSGLDLPGCPVQGGVDPGGGPALMATPSPGPPSWSHCCSGAQPALPTVHPPGLSPIRSPHSCLSTTVHCHAAKFWGSGNKLVFCVFKNKSWYVGKTAHEAQACGKASTGRGLWWAVSLAHLFPATSSWCPSQILLC